MTILDDKLKFKLVESILDKMNWEGNSEFYPSFKSNDWLIQDDSVEVTLYAEGNVKLTDFNLSKEEIDDIVEELKDNETVSEFLADILDDFKDSHIQSYKFDYKVSLKDDVIKITANTYEIEIQE